jgi:hypothetical protein
VTAGRGKNEINTKKNVSMFAGKEKYDYAINVLIWW